MDQTDSAVRAMEEDVRLAEPMPAASGENALPPATPVTESAPAPDLELWRAAWHSLTIAACGVVAGFVPFWLGLWLMLFAVMLFGYWEVRRFFNPEGYNFQHKPFFKTMMRPDELHGRTSAGTDYLLALFIIYPLLPVKLMQVTVLMVAFGDPGARMIGRRFGRLKLPFSDKKTWMGSLGCLGVASLVGVISGEVLGLDPRLPIVGAVAATLMEAIPDRRWLLADNFRMTVVTGLAMYWFQNLGILP